MKLFIVTLSLLALGVCLSSAKPSPALDADPEAEGFLISIFRSISTRVATQTFRKGQDLRGKFDESEEESVGKIWSDCGTSSDMSVIKNVTISPDPPKAGQQLTIDANFVLKENITGGSFTANVKYGFLPSIKKTIQVCDDLAKMAGLSCPVSQNTSHILISTKVPSFVPSGHYKGQVIGVDQTGKRIGCINIDARI